MFYSISISLLSLAFALFMIVQPDIRLRAFVVAEKCDVAEMDENIFKIVGYLEDPKLFYPQSSSQLTKFCNNYKTGSKFLKEYSNECLHGVSKTIIGVFAFSNARNTRKYCGKTASKKAQTDLMSYAKCANPNKPALRQCYRYFLNQINQTNSIADAKQRLPFTCCANIRMKRCIIQQLEQAKNAAQCSDDMIHGFATFFESVSGNIMNAVCEISEESFDRCTKIFKLPKAKLTNVNQRTPFPMAISIFENL